MKTLDLYRLWRIMDKISKRQEKLFEENKYIHLLGGRSSYSAYDFESFLSYYCFRFEEDLIVVFNDDGIPWEDYRTNDFSYIPSSLLSFTENELDEWIEKEVEEKLNQLEARKISEKESIKKQIESLQTKLNTL